MKKIRSILTLILVCMCCLSL